MPASKTRSERSSGMQKSELKGCIQLYESLVGEWNKKKHDLERCSQLIAQVKVELTKLRFQPTTEGDDASKQELLLSRDFLEIAALHSLEQDNIQQFNRYFMQLKPYYFDYGTSIPESPYKFQLLGLNLMCLLSKNRLSDFHTEIELLPVDDVTNNIYLKHPLKLEQYLMEGSYHKIIVSRDNVPAPHYRQFMDSLVSTVREEIGACIEAAYTELEASEAARMLFFTSKQPMLDFAEKRGWYLNESSCYKFDKRKTLENPNKPCGISERAIPSRLITERNIEYATELDTIV